MGPMNSRIKKKNKQTNNKSAYNQDPNTYLIQLQRTIVIKVELNC